MTINNTPQQPQSQPDSALINRIITIQEKEFLIRTEELSLKKQEDTNAFEYSKIALEAHVKDRAAEREHTKSTLKYTYIFALIVVLAFFGFLGTALYLDKEQIAIEIVKAIIYLTSGGISGYAFAKRKNHK